MPPACLRRGTGAVFQTPRNASVSEMVQALLEGMSGEVGCRYFGESVIQKNLGRKEPNHNGLYAEPKRL